MGYIVAVMLHARQRRQRWDMLGATIMTPTHASHLRLSDELLERIDRQVERIRREQDGLKVSRADVIRMLLEKALDAIEGKAKKSAGK